MELNLSAEMIHALYIAAKESKREAWNKDKRQFDMMSDFIELVEFMSNDTVKVIRKPAKERKKMKHLILAEGNNQNYIIIRDMNRGDDDTAIVNWDLSDEEIEEIRNEFKADEDSEKFFEVTPEWQPFEKIINLMNNFEHIG